MKVVVFGAGGVGQVTSGLVSIGDGWRTDWVAKGEQDQKRRKYSVLQPPFRGGCYC
jgi:hypothetical protein